jgi:CBS domain containing-hemolysin-like protein
VQQVGPMKPLKQGISHPLPQLIAIRLVQETTTVTTPSLQWMVRMVWMLATMLCRYGDLLVRSSASAAVLDNQQNTG